MPDAVQITDIAQRTVVRLKSFGLTPLDGGSLVPASLASETRILSLGPGEWWLTSDTMTGTQLRGILHHHLAGRDIAPVDLSCAYKALRIEGRATGSLLAKGCGLDLHPRYFAPGHATRTRFAQLAVTLECVDAAPRFDLYTGRSYFAWLKSWLEDAAVEFHYAID